MREGVVGIGESDVLLFYFQCYGDLRDLHSFPTRRSADLEELVSNGVGEELVRTGEEAEEVRTGAGEELVIFGVEE